MNSEESDIGSPDKKNADFKFEQELLGLDDPKSRQNHFTSQEVNKYKNNKKKKSDFSTQ